MTRTEKYDIVNDLLTEIQHWQPCKRHACNVDCKYMAYEESGDGFCMIDGILDEVYRELRTKEIL